MDYPAMGSQGFSLLELIKEARELQKTYYSGLEVVFTFYQSFEDTGAVYSIGTITSKGTWERNVYKLYNMLEESGNNVWQSQFKEKQQDKLFIQRLESS